MSAEDEFADRDARGLETRKKDGPADDDAAMAKAQVHAQRHTFQPGRISSELPRCRSLTAPAACVPPRRAPLTAVVGYMLTSLLIRCTGHVHEDVDDDDPGHPAVFPYYLAPRRAGRD